MINQCVRHSNTHTMFVCRDQSTMDRVECGQTKRKSDMHTVLEVCGFCV